MTTRAFLIHFARVHLAECRARRHSRANRTFYWHLYESAQEARRQAGDATVRDLFGAIAS